VTLVFARRPDDPPVARAAHAEKYTAGDETEIPTATHGEALVPNWGPCRLPPAVMA
jgi:hypothetical protein